MTSSLKNVRGRDYFISIFIIGILFFIFGFVTWLNGTLIPFLKISCELNNTQAYYVTFAFYISYFVMALPSSWILMKTGFKGGMSLGLIVMAVGSLVFIPAAMSRTYGLFLTGLFIQGTGLAILQTAVNPYVTILGPIESAARRISIMGICNKIAGVLSPIILGAVVLYRADDIQAGIRQAADTLSRNMLLDELASKVIIPYIIMALVLLALMAMLRWSPIPEIDTEKSNEEQTSLKKTPFPALRLLLGFLAIFLYVGAEVIAGDTIGLFGQSQGISLDIAKTFTSYTLFSMVLGYILGIVLIPKVIRQDKALAVSAVIGVIITVFAIWTGKFTAVMSIALLGFANAVMWPAIWPLAIDGMGKYTKIASAVLIMGIAGGAIMPIVYGRLADIAAIGPQQSYWILVPCYIYILFYALILHKTRK